MSALSGRNKKMKRLTWLAASALLIIASPVIAQQAKPVIYVIVEISDMTDVDTYMKQVMATEPAASAAHNGHFVVRTNTATELDGTPPGRFVIAEFPNEADARAWYAATEKTNALRQKLSKSRAFFVEIPAAK